MHSSWQREARERQRCRKKRSPSLECKHSFFGIPLGGSQGPPRASRNPEPFLADIDKGRLSNAITDLIKGLTTSVTLGPLGRYANPSWSSPLKFPFKSTSYACEGWWRSQSSWLLRGNLFRRVGIDAPYTGLEEPSKDARKTGPTFVHPTGFH